jgi:hypothetical protein
MLSDQRFSTAATASSPSSSGAGKRLTRRRASGRGSGRVWADVNVLMGEPSTAVVRALPDGAVNLLGGGLSQFSGNAEAGLTVPADPQGMSSFAAQPQSRKPTREEALAVASQRKAARHRRTTRIRKTVAILAVAAFIGPFGVIYSQVASGKDPGLAATSNKASVTTAGTSTTGSASASTSSASTSSGSTSSGSAASTPAPVTTQQS